MGFKPLSVGERCDDRELTANGFKKQKPPLALNYSMRVRKGGADGCRVRSTSGVYALDDLMQ